MFIKILFFYCYSLYATEFSITSDTVHFKIVSNDTVLSYSDLTTDLSINKKKCNQNIFNRISTSLTNLLSNPISDIDREKMLVIRVDNKNYFESPSTARAKYFLNFKTIFNDAKIEELLNCKNKK
jgi:hypothetical protein